MLLVHESFSDLLNLVILRYVECYHVHAFSIIDVRAYLRTYTCTYVRILDVQT